jgi:hypothetical protein
MQHARKKEREDLEVAERLKVLVAHWRGRQNYPYMALVSFQMLSALVRLTRKASRIHCGGSAARSPGSAKAIVLRAELMACVVSSEARSNGVRG